MPSTETKKDTEKLDKENGVYFHIRNEKELEFRIYGRGYLFHASTKESYDSKTKNAIESVASQLNHFIAYLRDRDDYNDSSDSDLQYFIMKLIMLNNNLNRNKIEKISKQRAEENLTNFREEKINYFNEVIYEELVYDDYLERLISEYSYESLKQNLEPSDIDEKLHYSDIHIFQSLSVYSKLLYLSYFHISELIGYNSLVKPIIIEMSRSINTTCLDLFPNEYNIVKNQSFMDRVFSYIEFQNRKNSRRHTRLIAKFSSIGYSHEYISVKMLDNILSSLKTFGPTLFEKTKKGYKKFDIVSHDLENWGYVAKVTVAWISRITFKTMYHLSKYTTSYVINSVNPDSGNSEGPEETPESSKYEILLEKKDREHFEDLQRLKKYIIADAKKDGRISEESQIRINQLIERKADITHLYNKFMVSLFLEQGYNVNIIDLLTYEEYLTLVFRVYERLDGYLDLRHALVSPETDNLNGIRVNDKDLENLTFYNNVNYERTKKIINKIISTSYGYKTKNGDIHYVTLKKEFLEFVSKGMVI